MTGESGGTEAGMLLPALLVLLAKGVIVGAFLAGILVALV